MKKLLCALSISLLSLNSFADDLDCSFLKNPNSNQCKITYQNQSLFNYAAGGKNTSLFYLQNHPDTLKRLINLCSSYQFFDRNDIDSTNRMIQICDNIAYAMSQGVLSLPTQPIKTK